MGFKEAISYGFQNYLNFNGRAGRSEYWYWTLFVILLCIVALLLDLTVLDVTDGRAPAQWERIKNHLSEFRSSCTPQVVFGPHRGDAHQDHRLVAELLPTEFRDHLVFGYEILKWEADTPRPTIFHPLATEVAEEKARLLYKHYPSQASHDWFDEQAFLGLSRLRGVQCRNPHAEGFILEKATVTFGATRMHTAASNLTNEK